MPFLIDGIEDSADSSRDIPLDNPSPPMDAGVPRRGPGGGCWPATTRALNAAAKARALRAPIEGGCERSRFLDPVRGFTALEDDGGRLAKQIAGRHRFHAVRAAVRETRRRAKRVPDRRVGGSRSGRTADRRDPAHTGSGQEPDEGVLRGSDRARPAPGARQLGQARLGAAADQVTVWGATGFHIPLRLPTSPVGAREGREDIGRDKKLDKDSGQKLLLSLTALKI